MAKKRSKRRLRRNDFNSVVRMTTGATKTIIATSASLHVMNAAKDALT